MRRESVLEMDSESGLHNHMTVTNAMKCTCENKAVRCFLKYSLLQQKNSWKSKHQSHFEKKNFFKQNKHLASYL